MTFQFSLVRNEMVQATIEPRVIDLSFLDSQQVVQRRCRIPALFHCQFAAGFTQPVDRQQRRNPRPSNICLVLIDQFLIEPVQFQPLPQLQPHKTVSELPASFQPNLVQQDSCDVRIVLRRLDLCRKQFQLPAFALLVENLNRLQPPCLRRAVQLAQITQRPLSRTFRRSDRFDQRPVRVPFAIFRSIVRPQEHAASCWQVYYL